MLRYLKRAFDSVARPLGVIVSAVVLLGALSVPFVWVSLRSYDQAQSAADRAVVTSQINADNAHSLCMALNEQNQRERGLWTYVLTIVGPPKSPAATQQLDAFKAFVATTFADHPCH